MSPRKIILDTDSGQDHTVAILLAPGLPMTLLPLDGMQRALIAVSPEMVPVPPRRCFRSGRTPTISSQY